ncbi:MAG: P1 family peptidase, partial [Cyclobacteriaceae bacterium]|nr:P1 family peptidase [Cyclobacteriaceae bacterium]
MTNKTNAQQRARDYGISIGVLPTGVLNAITDVAGVQVGHLTKLEGEDIRTGVTAILPHSGNLFQEKVPAAVFIGNGFGKLAGTTQIEELGNIESPIILTNTLSVAAGIQGVIEYTLTFPGNEQVQSVNTVVGETNDGFLNDIRGQHIDKEDVLKAIQAASETHVQEGNVGAGTGTVCFGFKGGIGTSSRKLPASLGGYTVGVLVQSNF